MRAIEDYQGDPAVMSALKLTPHVFQRPGELRQMEWAEVNFDKAVWTIPVTKMKMRQPHSVPLSWQALAILQAMRPLSGSGRYVFPSIRTRARPISENTINAVSPWGDRRWRRSTWLAGRQDGNAGASHSGAWIDLDDPCDTEAVGQHAVERRPGRRSNRLQDRRPHGQCVPALVDLVDR